MAQSPQPGVTLQPLLQRMQHARPLHRVASVKNAEPAGLNQLKMLVTANTNAQTS